MHASINAIYIWGHPCTKHAFLGLLSRPITPASASAGPRPRTSMHVNAARPPPSGMHARKCRSTSGLGSSMHVNAPRPPASGMHARKCPSASGLGHLRACMSSVSGRPWPRQA
eukprot:366466-Chlamydomonas_euryale.AAC.22